MNSTKRVTPRTTPSEGIAVESRGKPKVDELVSVDFTLHVSRFANESRAETG